jgi:hypothetical protein
MSVAEDKVNFGEETPTQALAEVRERVQRELDQQ